MIKVTINQEDITIVNTCTINSPKIHEAKLDKMEVEC